MTHFHITVIGWDKQVDDVLQKPVDIDVVALDVKSAILRAKEIYPRKHWFVRRIVECFGMHGEEVEQIMLNIADKLKEENK